MRDSEFDFIRQLVYERSRIHLGPDKRDLVAARLGKRLRATQLASITDYCQLLRGPDCGEELGHLIDAISTNHTFFFRESAHFDFLRSHLVPELIEQQRKERWSTLRAWSAASSSGEEPYTLAITLAEALAGTNWPFRIDATDISRRILARAEAAIYPAAAMEKVPPALIKTYFQRGFGPQDGNYRVKPFLRSTVHYRHLNLLEGAFPFNEPFHFIFCRNVMIYFDRPTQEELVNKLARQLIPGGYLFVGHAESLSGIKHPLQLVRPAIYRRPAS